MSKENIANFLELVLSEPICYTSAVDPLHPRYIPEKKTPFFHTGNATLHLRIKDPCVCCVGKPKFYKKMLLKNKVRIIQPVSDPSKNLFRPGSGPDQFGIRLLEI